MIMAGVKSSNISRAGYDKNVMRVQFSNGTKYDYKDVPAAIFNDFMTAKSQGKYFNKNIKTKYTAIKVTEEDSNE